MDEADVATDFSSVVRRVREGDEAALESLVVAFGDDVLRVALVASADLDTAKDAAQRTWIIAWQRMASLREPSRVKAWLLTIAANEARLAGRRTRRRHVRELATARMPEEPNQPLDRLRLEEALRRLGQDDRQLLALHYVGGFSYQELAAWKAMSTSGMRGRLSRAISRLRTLLEE